MEINCLRISVAGDNDGCKAGDKEAEHGDKQAVDAFLRALELLPDEHAPDCGDHGSALPECVGHGGTGLLCHVPYNAEISVKWWGD